eukprot:2460324-Prymnesium_polylepis.1
MVLTTGGAERTTFRPLCRKVGPFRLPREATHRRRGSRHAVALLLDCAPRARRTAGRLPRRLRARHGSLHFATDLKDEEGNAGGTATWTRGTWTVSAGAL